MENKRAKSFVTIMIVIAVFAFLLRFLIEGVIKINISQNESTASVNLKLISAALENYADEKSGMYPQNLSFLIKTEPAYLDKDYILESPMKGYYYACSRLEPTGYSCSASPVKCGLSGNLAFTITTGSILVSEKCEIKE
jgi:type II secretory pathway pseudopilin PulG